MSKKLVEIVRCKNCVHRPIKGEDPNDVDPPKNSRGYEDYTCPCLNEDDGWYSWYPPDEWFCANGEMKGDTNRVHKDYQLEYEEKDLFPAIEGAPIEMFVDGVWEHGKVIKGYRFNDGIVTMETEDGRRFWCGQERTDIFRKYKEKEE